MSASFALVGAANAGNGRSSARSGQPLLLLHRPIADIVGLPRRAPQSGAAHSGVTGALHPFQHVWSMRTSLRRHSFPRNP